MRRTHRFFRLALAISLGVAVLALTLVVSTFELPGALTSAEAAAPALDLGGQPVERISSLPESAGGLRQSAFCGSVTDVPASECTALEALYNSTNGAGWTNNTGWLSSTTVCSWTGVICSGNHVTSLYLSNNGLAGFIPSEIGSLPYLLQLDLSSNFLSGSIPATMSNLQELRLLQLQNNALEGDIPLSVAQLPFLGELGAPVDFGYNKLSANPSTQTVLNTKDSDWAYTQTVPPVNLDYIPMSSSSAMITWTPILYTWDPGYYIVYRAPTPGGPFSVGCTTFTKADATCTMTGLVGGAPYYFFIQTYTAAHGAQHNSLWSSLTSPIFGGVLPPDNLNLVRNSTFNAGDEQWAFWGDITHNVVGGEMLVYQGGGGGVMYQDLNFAAPASAGFEATLQLGNTSATATKSVSVLLHNPDWSEAFGCVFTIGPDSPLSEYTVRSRTNKIWTNMRLEIFPGPADSEPAVKIDNVSVRYKSTLNPIGTECIAPTPVNTNLVTNGDFAAGSTGWGFWGTLQWNVVSETLSAYLAYPGPGGAYQLTNYSLPANAPVELKLELTNPSPTQKIVNVTAQSSTGSEAFTCVFYLSPAEPTGLYTMRFKTNLEWANARVDLSPGPADSVPTVLIDNINMQYKPSMLVSGSKECIAPPPPANVNLLQNGGFSNGSTGWTFWGSIQWGVISDLLSFYGGLPGPSGFFQDVPRLLPANAPMELTFDLGNYSNVPKSLWVILEAPGGGGMAYCYFQLQPNTPLRPFTMRMKTNTPWQNIRVAFTPEPSDHVPTMLIDSINLQYKPALSVSGTECIAPPLPSNVNLLQNGDFSAGTSSWNFWGNMVYSATGGTLSMYRTDGTGTAFQAVNQAIPAGAPLELTLDIGNSSPVLKTVVAVVHNDDWSDSFGCSFNLNASTALHGTYKIRGKTTKAWSRAWVELAPENPDSVPTVLVDNVSLQYKPSLIVTVPECIDAIAPAADPDLSVDNETPETTVELLPTATPFPTESEVVEEPTLEPTQEVVLVGQVVESDSASVTAEGVWTSFASDAASGGAYLYNEGTVNDRLSLSFSGTALDVVYVQHPSLGVFAVEVDGLVVQVVDSRAETSIFNARAQVSGLADGTHTVAVYPLAGTIAIDAFVIGGTAEPSGASDTPDTGSVDVPEQSPDVFPTATPLPQEESVTDFQPTPIPFPTSASQPNPQPAVSSSSQSQPGEATGQMGRSN